MSAQGGNANAVNGASDAKFGINPFETAKGEYTPTDAELLSYLRDWAETEDRIGREHDFLFVHDRLAELAAHDADLTARLAAAEATIAEALSSESCECYAYGSLSAYRPVAAHPTTEEEPDV